MIYLIGIIVALIGYALFQRSKRRSAEALNTNLETKEQVLDIQKDVEKNNAEIEAEKQKQADLQKKADEEKAKDVSKEDLVDFFNNKSNK